MSRSRLLLVAMLIGIALNVIGPLIFGFKPMEPVAEFEGYVEGMPVIRLVGGKLTAGTELYARPK